MDEDTRRDLKLFADRWRVAGPALEDQRLQELWRLSDEQARRMTLDLFRFWRPDRHDDFGAGLVEQQRVFRLRREREQGQR